VNRVPARDIRRSTLTPGSLLRMHTPLVPDSLLATAGETLASDAKAWIGQGLAMCRGMISTTETVGVLVRGAAYG